MVNAAKSIFKSGLKDVCDKLIEEWNLIYFFINHIKLIEVHTASNLSVDSTKKFIEVHDKVSIEFKSIHTHLSTHVYKITSNIKCTVDNYLSKLHHIKVI